MAVGTTGTANVTKARKLFVASAIYVQTPKEIAAALVDKKTLPHGMGTTWNEPVWPAFTAANLTDGVAIASPIQITDASIVITPAEVGAQLIFTRKMAQTISENFATAAGKLLGNAIARKKDKDVLAILQAASVGLGGTTTTTSGGLIAAASSGIETGIAGTARAGALADGDPAPKPYFYIGHPYTRYDLWSQFGGFGGAPTQVTTAAAVGNYFGQALYPGIMTDTLRNHFSGSIADVDCYFDGNITINAGPNVVNVVGARESTVMVQFNNLDVDQEWNGSLRAWQWTATEDYGVGPRADAWMRKVTTDATAPAT